jgi:hypothetical protein
MTRSHGRGGRHEFGFDLGEQTLNAKVERWAFGQLTPDRRNPVDCLGRVEADERLGQRPNKLSIDSINMIGVATGLYLRAETI